MERIVYAFSQHPIETAAVVAAVIVAMIVPLPLAKRFDWDNVRQRLTVSQRFEYAAIVHLPVIAAALIAYCYIAAIVTLVRPLVTSGNAIPIVILVASVVIYGRRVQETWALNRVCERAFGKR